MIEVQFLIPVADNAGQLFDWKHDIHFENFLISLFGGYSKLSLQVAGGWIDGGKVYRDTSRVFAVFVDGLLANGPAVMNAINLAKTHFGQLKITARYLDHAEIL